MKRFIFIGDFCWDQQIFGSCNRLNPEAPVPILNVDQTCDPTAGMAGNVINNFMRIVDAGFSQWTTMEPVEVCTLINRKDRREDNDRKVRFIDETSGYILLRVDHKGGNKETFRHQHKLAFDQNINENCVVVISDYDKGFLDSEMISYVASRCSVFGVPCFLDTKKPIGQFWNQNFAFIKINQHEYQASLKEDQKVVSMMTNVIVTMAEKGSTLMNHGVNVPLAQPVEVRDVCGAGDAYLAALAYMVTMTPYHIKAVMNHCNLVATEVCKNHSSMITTEQAELAFEGLK